MAKKEEPTGRAARIRGGLPGDTWREYVHPGAIKAYEGPLAPSREQAAALRKKGRLVEAHRTEKGAFKIRARGYDRKYKGEEAVGKALTIKKVKFGPYRSSSTEWRIRPLSRSEERRRNLVAAGKTIGGLKTVAALGGGAALTGVVQDSKKKTSDSASNIVRHVSGKEKSVVTSKSLDIYTILGKSYESPYEIDGLVEINKTLLDFTALKASKLGDFGRKVATGVGEGGVSGGTKFGGAHGSWKGGQEAWKGAGGWKGLRQAAEESPDIGTAGKYGAGIAGTAGAAGLGLWGAKVAAKHAKKKALKYAGYAALGTGAAVAGGTAIGNMVSPHSRA